MRSRSLRSPLPGRHSWWLEEAHAAPLWLGVQPPTGRTPSRAARAAAALPRLPIGTR